MALVCDSLGRLRYPLKTNSLRSPRQSRVQWECLIQKPRRKS